MNDVTPSLKEFSPVTFALARNNLEQDRREHERLVGRRDALRDKLRSGLATLNGGSLLALLAALNGQGSAASWLGVGPHNALWIASAFTLGLISAAASFRVAETDTLREISDSIKRVGASERIAALYEAKTTIEDHEKIVSEFTNYAQLPLVGHRFSNSDFICLAISQISRLAGILKPFSNVAFS